MCFDLYLVLIGYGFVGCVFYVLLIQYMFGLVLYSIVSLQCDMLLCMFSNVYVCVMLQDVFDDLVVDVVVIVMLNEQYVLLVMVVLVVGKYVLVDKFFVLDVVEVEMVLVVVCDVGCIVIVFQNWCFDVDFFMLQVLLVEGMLGEVVECYVYFDCYWLQVCDCWCEWDMLGSGLWYDFGLYLLDQMLVLFGWFDVIDVDLVVQC